MAIRRNHGLWLPEEEEVYPEPWQEFKRTFSNGTTMVCAPAIALAEIGNQYGFRTWIEYGLKQATDALGWVDCRMTRYAQSQKWWELVMSAFLMVSLFADQFNDSCPLAHQQFTQHPWWNNQLR